MDDKIAGRISSVLWRVRLHQYLWILAGVWLILSMVGLGAWIGLWPTTGSTFFRGWLAAATFLTLAVWCWVRFWLSNLDSVVRKIEQNFPSLEGRLATAIEVRPDRQNGRLSYLQRAVISETLIHDIRYSWQSIVSWRRLATAWLVNSITLLALAIVGWGLLGQSRNASVEVAARIAESIVAEPIVEPGNVQIQRGDNLIITAKFPASLPGQVWLVRQPIDAKASERASLVNRQLMQQSLSDPLFAAYLSDIRQATEYHVEYDGHASPSYNIQVFDLPEVVRVDARLGYPLYTGLAPKSIVDTRRVSAPMGTTLEWQIHINQPIVRGRLQPKAESTQSQTKNSAAPELNLQPSVDNALVWSCSFPVQGSAQWLVELVDDQGHTNKIEVSLRATAIPNKPPEIVISSGGDAVVSALEEFAIEAKIKEDYKLAAAGINYQLAGGEMIENTLPLLRSGSTKSSRDWQVSDLIDFEALAAQPGQLLAYYLWAEDHDEQGQARRITSDMFFAEVRPFDEIYRQGEANSQQQEPQAADPSGEKQADELLELQRQIISASWNIARLAPSTTLAASAADDLAVVAQSQQEAMEILQQQAAMAGDGAHAPIVSATQSMQTAAEQLQQAVSSLKKSDLLSAISSEQMAYQALLQMQSRDSQVAQGRQRRQSSSQSRRQQSRQQQLQQLELDQPENRYQDQRLANRPQADALSQMRQVSSRLRELAMRQQDLNQQLREAQAALQAAESQQQREQQQQRLERLREQQQQILEDADELQQQLQANQSAEMQLAEQRLAETRQNLQQANQSLRENDSSQALAAGTRAQEQLQQMREQVRQQAANQFSESMQQMQSAANELQQRQQQLSDDLGSEPKSDSYQSGLRDHQQQTKVADSKEALEHQRQDLSELLRRMQETIEQAEEAEPLLAQKLFDSYQRTQQQQIEEQLKMTDRLIERGLQQQAQRLAEKTSQDLRALDQDLRQAADALLGSELNSLRLALDQLDTARQQVEQEMDQAMRDQSGDINRPNSTATEESNKESNLASSSTSASTDEPQPTAGSSGSLPQLSTQENQPSRSDQVNPTDRSDRFKRTDQTAQATEPTSEATTGAMAGPIAGDGFRQWSDRLREVEELVTDPELRWQAERIRQSARQMRVQWQSGSAPRWSDVEQMVAEPLRQLQQNVSRQLLLRAAERTEIVPIDRDPVPLPFKDRVQEYYQRLGEGK